jgi:hypothetical protein
MQLRLSGLIRRDLALSAVIIASSKTVFNPCYKMKKKILLN